MKRILILAGILFSVYLPSCLYAAQPEKPFDHSKWQAFLQKYVDEKGAVDFAGAKGDTAVLDEYLEQLKMVTSLSLNEWPREEAVAYWINAYHASLMRLILKNYPVKSVQEIQGVWDLKFFESGHEAYSLNDIRNNELMDQYHDEKIHFALSCMAVSCPQLSREAYTGPRLEGQLFEAAQRFVNDAEKNNIDPINKKVELSKFFKWYGRDFSFNFGKPENERKLSKEEFSTLSFIVYYLEDSDKVNFLEDGRYKIRFLSFDWTLKSRAS